MSYYEMVYETNMFGNPSSTYFNAINGVAPIVVTTVGNTATISHANSGIAAGIYTNPSIIQVNATGHVESITTSGSPFITGVAVQDETVPVVTTSTLNFAGAGVTVTESPAGTALITIPAAAATTQGVVYGLTGGTATSNAGIGYNISFGAATQDTIVGSGSSTTGSGGLNAILGCTSTTASQYTQIHGTGVTVGSSANFCNIHGSGTTVANNCNSSNGLGYAQTFGHANCVLLGDGASTSAADELATGSQTRLRFPSLSQAAAGANSYPMLWDSSTKVCVPATVGYGVFTAFTATWTNINQNNGTQDCRYARFGDAVFVLWKLTFGNTTSVTGDIGASLPITAASSQGNDGICYGFDNSTGNSRSGFAISDNTPTDVYPYTPGFVYWNATNPFTWATSDIFTITLWYRV